MREPATGRRGGGGRAGQLQSAFCLPTPLPRGAAQTRAWVPHTSECTRLKILQEHTGIVTGHFRETRVFG